jgi:hypothetical protein
MGRQSPSGLTINHFETNRDGKIILSTLIHIKLPLPITKFAIIQANRHKQEVISNKLALNPIFPRAIVKKAPAQRALQHNTNLFMR